MRSRRGVRRAPVQALRHGSCQTWPRRSRRGSTPAFGAPASGCLRLGACVWVPASGACVWVPASGACVWVPASGACVWGACVGRLRLGCLRSGRRAAMTQLPVISDVGTAVYVMPTDAPEADGTLTWNETTLVLVTVRAAGEEGMGWTYGAAAAASVVTELLAGVVLGCPAFSGQGILRLFTRLPAFPAARP